MTSAVRGLEASYSRVAPALRAYVSWTELEFPSAVASRGYVSWAELEFPFGGDLYRSFVVAHFHFDGANGDGTPFANSKTGTTGGDLSVGSGSPVLSSAHSKFGGTSLFVNGGQSVGNTNSLDFAFGTGDFTVEFWMYQTALQTKNLLDIAGSLGSDARPLLYTDTSGNLHWYSNNTERIVSAGGLLTVNTGHDIAVARVSGTTRMFIDGTVAGSFADSTDMATVLGSGALQVPASSTRWAGYIDELRITKGVGRYTANYTPATTPFPDA